jgi:hypothetical protein
MSGYEAITAETLEEIKKAQTNGVTYGSSLVGYDLSQVVSLIPVNTPFYDRVPRRSASQGSASAYWKALLDVTNAQPNPFTGADGGGNFVQVSELDISAPFRPIRVSGKVTRDAIAYGNGYADAKAIASTQTLMQWRILDNKALLGGQAFALPTIGTPTLTASATGGAIAQSTAIYMRVQARSSYNFYWGGAGVAAAQATVTTAAGTATNSVTATVPAVRGAVAYDWFASGTSGTWYYVTTTTVNKYVFTSIPVAAASSVPNIPALYRTVPSVVTATDGSFDATNAYNGLIASLTGSYLNSGQGLATYGSGSTTDSGSTVTSLDGATLTGSSQGVAEIDAMLMSIYNKVQCSPTVMVMSAQQAQDIALKVLGTNAAVTYLTAGDPGRRGYDAGATVSGYINRASGGDRVEILVDPHFPTGQIAFLTERVPFPNSNIANTFEARTLQDVTQFDYGASLSVGANGGPRMEWDTSSIETFVNRAPVACGLLTNVAAG